MATKIFFQQKTPCTKYQARYIRCFDLDIPAENINLYKRLTQMTDAEYVSYSPAHLAMSSNTNDDLFQMTNVENIGIEMLVQHYELKYFAANHVQLYSSHTRAYIMRWIPATIAVPWELFIQPVSPDKSRLICLIGVDFPNLALKVASWLSSLGGLFLSRHLQEEGQAFAKHIERTFNAVN